MKKTLIIWGLIILAACSKQAPVAEITSDDYPAIFPDYVDCTIPPNTAPLHFGLQTAYEEAFAVLSSAEESFTVKAGKKQFSFPVSKWKALLESAQGQSIQVRVLAKENGQWVAYKPFNWLVAPEAMDPYIAYRLIEPEYATWNKMGIYQRDLESFKQTAILENKMTHKNCMNCHSFCMQDPEQMLFHTRMMAAGTILIQDGEIEKLNTKTPETISSLVYPYWHPSGKFVAFSVNETKQAFHTNHVNRVEVYDAKSDVVVYDIQKQEILTTPLLFAEEVSETFPAFSPDGKTLYFCSAAQVDLPENFQELKYSLCSVSFNPETKTFGTQVDTLYHAAKGKRSVSFPRVSPDGKYLMYALSDYGNFTIWHKDADLYMIDLAKGTHYPLTEANSESAESYHSWSSNSRWVVFGSRRLDDLYTRPYIAYIDSDGQAHKPFLVPQKEVDYYGRFMKSYNIPEFITGKVKNQAYKISMIAKKSKGTAITFKE